MDKKCGMVYHSRGNTIVGSGSKLIPYERSSTFAAGAKGWCLLDIIGSLVPTCLDVVAFPNTVLLHPTSLSATFCSVENLFPVDQLFLGPKVERDTLQLFTSLLNTHLDPISTNLMGVVDSQLL